MKNKLISLGYGISFVSIFLVLLFIVSGFVKPKNGELLSGRNIKTQGYLEEKSDTIDLVVMGDSLAYSSVIPIKLWEKMGITSFLGSVSSQKLTYTYSYLQNIIKNQKIKMLILETNMFFRKNDFLNVAVQEIQDAFPVFEYHSRWKNILAKNIDIENKYTQMLENKGFRPRYEVKEADSSKYLQRTKKKQHIPEINKKLIYQIKELCDKNEIKLMFLSTPSTINWKYKKHNAIVDLAKEMNVKFVDLNLKSKEIGIDWKRDTFDKGDHLNAKGAIKVTSALIDILSKEKVFNDKRQNPNFKDWNESLKKFNKVMNEKIGKSM